jgi:hypothetical protein
LQARSARVKNVANAVSELGKFLGHGCFRPIVLKNTLLAARGSAFAALD